MSFFVLNSFVGFFYKKDFLCYGEEIAKITSQIYQKRKVPDSPGGFKYRRTKEKNSRII